MLWHWYYGEVATLFQSVRDVVTLWYHGDTLRVVVHLPQGNNTATSKGKVHLLLLIKLVSI